MKMNYFSFLRIETKHIICKKCLNITLALFEISNCLISCRAGARHYRIFPDFLNSGLKMASKIEGKAKVIACS